MAHVMDIPPEPNPGMASNPDLNIVQGDDCGEVPAPQVYPDYAFGLTAEDLVQKGGIVHSDTARARTVLRELGEVCGEEFEPLRDMSTRARQLRLIEDDRRYLSQTREVDHTTRYGIVKQSVKRRELVNPRAADEALLGRLAEHNDPVVQILGHIRATIDLADGEIRTLSHNVLVSIYRDALYEVYKQNETAERLRRLQPPTETPA